MLDRFKSEFTEARWEELCELVKDKGMKVTFHDFTMSELKVIISETRLSENERKGAIMYYVEGIPASLIAKRLHFSDTTVKNHKKKISRLLRETCCRIFK